MTQNDRSARSKEAYTIRPEDIVEPVMTDEDWQDFRRGVELFNKGEFWKSHEAWELIWKRHFEPSRIFFQGLIQLAASYHQLQRGIYHGVVKHFNNAYLKLAQFPDVFLSVDSGSIKDGIRAGLDEAERVGEGGLAEFNQALVVSIEPHPHRG
jgi:hypothetical protein